MSSIDRIKKDYPLHYFVWENKFGELENGLEIHKVKFWLCKKNGLFLRIYEL